MTEFDRSNETNAEISRRLEIINKYYPLDELVSHGTANSDVASYYRASEFFYRHVHAHGGKEIHMGLSADGAYHKEDLLAQAKFIASLIGEKTERVLEIGAGALANTGWLCEKFPKVSFSALDIPGRGFLKKKAGENVKLFEGDYHDLSRFEPGSFDIVFGVETVCYSADKKKVYSECFRVLKPGGKLVIFDLFEPRPGEEMTDFEKFVSNVVLASMRVTGSEQYIGDMRSFLSEVGFNEPEFEDLTDAIRPSLKRLERIAGKYFRHPALVKTMRAFISDDATMNGIAGWLIVLSVEKIHGYCRLVAEKPL